MAIITKIFIMSDDVLVLNANGIPLSMIPLSVISWQTALRLMFTDKVKVLKEYDDWTIRSQHITMSVPSIIIMTEQVKWSKTVNYSRNNVFLRDDFTCQLQTTRKCKDQRGRARLIDLTLDHVVPKSLGGKTTWTNVCTSCRACNGAKGADHTIVPKNMPKKPTYYDILAKRKTQPIHIKDKEWQYYLAWPDHLINLVPHNTSG